MKISNIQYLIFNIMVSMVFSVIPVQFTISNIQYLNIPNVSASTLSKTTTDNSLASLKNGLVSWWTFDGRNVNITQVLDASGNGYTGTRNGGVKVITGKIGQGMFFDGSDDWIPLSSQATIPNGPPFTISAWIKPLPGCSTLISEWGGVGSGRGVDLRCSGNSMEITICNGATCETATGVDNVLDGRWHFVTFTYDSSKLSVYVDTKLSGTPASSGSKTFTAGNARIGDADVGSTRYWKGSMDDIRVYSRILSTAEIQQLYKMGGGKISKTPTSKNLGINSGLVLWWTFDSKDWSTSVTTTDKSGNGNDGGRTDGVTKKTGKIGQSIFLNGSNSKVVRNNPTNLDFSSNSQSFTASIWARPTDFSGWDGLISAQKTGDSAWQIARDNGNTNFDFIFFGATDKVSFPSVNLGDWHLYTAVYDGTNLKAYFDGKFYSSDPRNSTKLNENIICAGIYRCGESAHYFQGNLDDMRIYNRALSATEIQELYKMGGGKISKTPTSKNLGINRGLVGYWTFDKKDITATQGLDISGNGNNGTKYNLTATTGKIGQGLNFSSSTLVIPNSASLNIYGTRNPVTLAAWIKYDHMGNSTYGSLFVHKGLYPTYEYGFAVSAEPSAYFDFRVNQAGAFRLVDYPVSMDKKWHHWTGVYDGYYMKLYQDGLMVSSTTHTGTVNQDTRNLTLGRYAAGEGYEVYAKMDDVRVYNRALSAAEVYQLYVMGR